MLDPFPKNWVFSVTPDNWEILKRENVWAVRSQTIAAKIKEGDRLIFYVAGSKPPSFMGAYEVAGGWRKSIKLRWSDEFEAGKVIYAWEVDLNPIILGAANVKELAAKLTFIGNKRRWLVYLRGTPANFGRPIPEEDYELILNSMKTPSYEVTFKPKLIKLPKVTATPTPPTPSLMPSHSEVRDMVLKLGELEGYVVEKEVPLDKERLDAAWRMKVREVPDVAFEIQRKGDFYGALVKLKEAWDRWRCISILVTSQEYEGEAKRWLGSAFHEMERNARVVRWEKIKRWLDLMEERKRIKDEIGIHD